MRVPLRSRARGRCRGGADEGRVFSLFRASQRRCRAGAEKKKKEKEEEKTKKKKEKKIGRLPCAGRLPWR